MADIYDMEAYDSSALEGEDQPSDLEERGRLWLKRLRKARDDLADWRSEARDCFAFVAGDQWSQDDVAKLEEQGRPVVVFNRLVRTVNAVAGLEIQNRQEVRYFPREQGDVKVNELLTAAADWVRDNCDAEDEDSDAFREMVICGMGWTETLMDYEAQPDGKCLIERRDPLEMLWDTSARQKNISDKKWVAHIAEMDLEDFKQLWPEHENPAMLGTFWLTDDSDPHDATTAHEYQGDESSDPDRKSNKTWVAHIQYWEREVIHRVLGETGRMMDFNEERWNKVRDYVEAKGLRHVKTYRRVYKRMFLNGATILEEPPPPCDNDFTFQAMTGIRDRNRNYWFGLVSLAMDPQRWANKWLSQILHTLNSNSKGGLLAETSAVDDVEEVEDKWAQTDSIIWLRDGGMDKIREKGIAQYPEGLDRLLNYAMEAIDEVIGVSAEFLGLAGQAQAGILEVQRREAGVSLLAPLFDALRQYRKRAGRVLAYFIQKYLSDGRLIRITGQDGAQYIPLLQDPQLIEYDVVVDDAPSSTNMKNRTFAVLSELLPMAIQAGVPVPPQVLDYAPLPESLITQWKQMIANTGQSPVEQQAQALAMQRQQAEIEQIQADARLKGAKAQEAADQAVFKAMEKQQESAMAQQERWMKGLDAIMAQQQMEHDNAKLEREAVLESIKSSTEAMMSHMKLQQEAIKTQQAEVKAQSEAAKARAQSESAFEKRYQSGLEEVRDEARKMIEALSEKIPGSPDFSSLEEKLARIEQMSLSAPEPAPTPDLSGLVGAIQQTMAELMGGLEDLGDKITEIKSELRAPKRIERNEYGEAISVNGRPIIRDENGNITTIQ